MTFEDTLRAIVREELERALRGTTAANTDEVLDIALAAKEAKVCPKTLQRAAQRGELGRKCGARWRFTRGEVRDWALRGKKGSAIDIETRARQAAQRLLTGSGRR